MNNESPHIRSILEERKPQIPVAGKIRAGIKVMTRKTAENPKAAAIFNEGVRAGLSFSAIEDKIEKELGLANPLTPKNVPYFRVSTHDFKNPATAQRIMEMYATDGSSGYQLYSFPVVFAFDDWLQNLEHGMKMFGTSGIKYWSQYDAAGERFCMTLRAAEVDPKNQRAVKQWGGRTEIVRPDTDGRCDPERCQQYQSKQCTLGGRLLFWMPGIPGAALIELDTNSIYSMKQMRAQMQLIAGVRGGRIYGAHEGKAIFHLRKAQEEVSRIDDKGNPLKTKQWLCHLDADLPMTELMIAHDRSRALPALITTPEPEQVAAVEFSAAETVTAGKAEIQESENSSAKQSPYSPAVTALRRSVFAHVRRLKFDEKTFIADMVNDYGASWGSDEASLKAIDFNLAV